MSQNKATDHDKATGQARANGNKVAEAANDAAKNGKDAKSDAAETGKSAKIDTADNGKNAMSDAAENGKHAKSDAAETSKNATREAAETSKNATREAAETGKNVMREATENVEHHAEKSMDVALQVVEDTGRQLQSAQRDGRDLASFWLHTMQEQATHNVAAMQELAAAREWQDKLKVQSAFFSGSLERLQGVFAHYMEMTGNAMHGHGEAAVASAKRATKVAARA